MGLLFPDLILQRHAAVDGERGPAPSSARWRPYSIRL